ncbi:MAG: hypothetical protein ACXWKP_20905 [Bradyrhizobium sp.]
MAEALSEAIDNRHHGIAVGDRKRAAGAKIVLHVDYKQQIIVAEPDGHVAPASWLIRKPLAQSKGAISRHLPTAVIALPNLSRQRRHWSE